LTIGICFSANSLFGNPAFPDESPRILEPLPRPFHPRIYTFYETGENKKEMRLQGQHAEATKKVLDGKMKLNGTMPGVGKTYTGRGKSRRRR